MNYAELTAAIEDYTENSFTSVELATFVDQAEQRIYNTVQLAALRKNVEGLLTSGNKYLSCPSDFLSVFSIAVVNSSGEYVYLQDKDVNYIRAMYPSPTTTGLPKYYAIFGPTTSNGSITNELSLILGPMPDSNYTTELHYYYYPASIVDAGTSWLGDNFDSVLLYGALLEAASFMKSDPDTIKNYTERYNEALLLAKRLGDGLDRSDAYRSGQFRMPNLPQNTGVR